MMIDMLRVPPLGIYNLYQKNLLVELKKSGLDDCRIDSATKVMIGNL